METGRTIFSNLLKGDQAPRAAFIPLIGDLAARVGGLSAEAWNSDPTLWANSLVKTAEMLDFDGIVVGFDFTLLAEACGCRVSWSDDKPHLSTPPVVLQQAPEERGRLKSALEAARRIFQVCRKDRVCAAALTGPFTLAGQIFGSEAWSAHLGEIKEPLVRATEAFCRTAPDFLIFMENRPPAFNELSPAHRRIYATLKNITSYYDVAAGIYLQGYDPGTVEDYSAFKMDLCILGPALDSRKPSLIQVWAAGSDAAAVGTGLPLDDPEQAAAMIGEGVNFYHAQGKRPGFFFTSLGPVTRQANLESLRALILKISETVL